MEALGIVLRSRRPLLYAGIALAAGAIGVAVLALRPPSQSLLPPTVVAPAQAQQVEVRIRVTPAEAEVLLDGAPLTHPVQDRFPRGDRPHRLSVRALGHRSDERALLFDRDLDLAIALVRDAALPQRPVAPSVVRAPVTFVSPPVATRSPPAPVPPPVVAPPAAKTPATGKAVYKGTKAPLMTEFPE
ncbi:MAG: hypothetical protein EXR72_08900 [Myxococcales bacterium]|nr:hypothetical protein [Myxococcales bacterium]